MSNGQKKTWIYIFNINIHILNQGSSVPPEAGCCCCGCDVVTTAVAEVRLSQSPGTGLIFTFYLLSPPLSTSTLLRLKTSAANRLIGEVVQSRRRPLLGASPG